MNFKLNRWKRLSYIHYRKLCFLFQTVLPIDFTALHPYSLVSRSQEKGGLSCHPALARSWEEG